MTQVEFLFVQAAGTGETLLAVSHSSAARTHALTSGFASSIGHIRAQEPIRSSAGKGLAGAVGGGGGSGGNSSVLAASGSRLRRRSTTSTASSTAGGGGGVKGGNPSVILKSTATLGLKGVVDGRVGRFSLEDSVSSSIRGAVPVGAGWMAHYLLVASVYVVVCLKTTHHGSTDATSALQADSTLNRAVEVIQSTLKVAAFQAAQIQASAAALHSALQMVLMSSALGHIASASSNVMDEPLVSSKVLKELKGGTISHGGGKGDAAATVSGLSIADLARPPVPLTSTSLKAGETLHWDGHAPWTQKAKSDGSTASIIAHLSETNPDVFQLPFDELQPVEGEGGGEGEGRTSFGTSWMRYAPRLEASGSTVGGRGGMQDDSASGGGATPNGSTSGRSGSRLAVRSPPTSKPSSPRYGGEMGSGTVAAAADAAGVNASMVIADTSMSPLGASGVNNTSSFAESSLYASAVSGLNTSTTDESGDDQHDRHEAAARSSVGNASGTATMAFTTPRSLGLGTSDDAGAQSASPTKPLSTSGASMQARSGLDDAAPGWATFDSAVASPFGATEPWSAPPSMSGPDSCPVTFVWKEQLNELIKGGATMKYAVNGQLSVSIGSRPSARAGDRLEFVFSLVHPERLGAVEVNPRFASEMPPVSSRSGRRFKVSLSAADAEAAKSSTPAPVLRYKLGANWSPEPLRVTCNWKKSLNDELSSTLDLGYAINPALEVGLDGLGFLVSIPGELQSSELKPQGQQNLKTSQVLWNVGQVPAGTPARSFSGKFHTKTAGSSGGQVAVKFTCDDRLLSDFDVELPMEVPENAHVMVSGVTKSFGTGTFLVQG